VGDVAPLDPAGVEGLRITLTDGTGGPPPSSEKKDPDTDPGRLTLFILSFCFSNQYVLN